MEFDNLLRKYLSGTMSEAELDQFQLLLDRVPEYKSELRQMLELRSLLHDDALTLTPPTDLSEHVRIAVSSSFAADAIAEWEEESRRRAFIDPLRITAGALVAACLAVGVALSPTLPPGSANPFAAAHRVTASPMVAAVAPHADVMDHQSRIASRYHAPSIAGDATAVADRSSVTAQLDDAVLMLGHEVPVHATESGTSSGSNAMAEYNGHARTTDDFAHRLAYADRESILEHDPMQLLRRATVVADYNPSLGGAVRREIEPVQALTGSGQTIAMVDDDRRHMTFGVTLGSGRVVETSSASMVMQNSYYFSFNVSGSDRIGLEMGKSTFQMESRGDSPFAKNNPDGGGADDFFFANQNLNQSHASYVGLIGGDQRGSAFAKPTFEDPPSNGSLPTRELPTPPKSGDELKSTKSVNSQGGGSTTPPLPADQGVRVEEQKVTYGAVFYDRRIKLGSRWDLCGRVTLGGTDNAIVTNVRAYAAYATGFQNVTLTMGVGGSKLYNLNSSSTQSGSGNFGVYYGVETGF